ncbi:hypothetical protein CDAR_36951 [Caerostris darwini]|uniref:Uncharacterized protein n=1 Tax=Caerostris darwini TaxID=1538125 RepID=A0AAV4UVT9_9ARAC|nr:hypothetical protein CDAR_36951 [Caerostris darwini]
MKIEYGESLQSKVWFVINFRANGRLQIVQGTTKQDQYKTITEKRLLSQISEWLDDQFLCMAEILAMNQKQSANLLTNKNFNVLQWLGTPSEMNPIQNVKTAKQELIEKLIEAWHRKAHL